MRDDPKLDKSEIEAVRNLSNHHVNDDHLLVHYIIRLI